ncbi:MAG: ABC-three component system protein [Candidatus Falkowbacteria bacterium]
MYTRSIYLNKINNHLIILASSIKTKNQLFLTDDNKWSENFFKDLLNKICGCNLNNLNIKEKNYPGIDLGDTASRLCIQVTASNTSKKIQDTLDVSKKYKRHEEYDSIVILVVGYKKKYTKKFVSDFASFNPDSDIWDIRTVLDKIEPLDADRMREIVEYLDSELETIIKINPIDLLDEDILMIINLIFDYLQKNINDKPQDSQRKYKLQKRDDGFITKKNNLNKVSDTLFNNEIRPSLQYDKKIESFLGNPINAECQRKYFVITELLQKKYTENSEQFDNMGDLFGFVFNEVINYKNRKEVDDCKLLILLHNMYFNCDIGNNPN